MAVEYKPGTLLGDLFELPGVKEAMSKYSLDRINSPEEFVEKMRQETSNPHMVSYEMFKEKIATSDLVKKMILGVQEKENCSLEEATYFCYDVMYNSVSVKIIKHLVETDQAPQLK